MKKINFDKTTVMGIVGGLLVVGGQVLKGISDKKTNDAKLVEAVNKVVEEKLNQQ